MKKTKLILLMIILFVLFSSCEIIPKSEDMSKEQFFAIHEPVKTGEVKNLDDVLHFDTYLEAHEFLNSFKIDMDSKGTSVLNKPRAGRHSRPPGIEFYIDFHYSYVKRNDRFGDLKKVYTGVSQVKSYISGIRPFQYYKQQRYGVDYGMNNHSFHLTVEGLVDITIGVENIGIFGSYHIDGIAYVNQSGRIY